MKTFRRKIPTEQSMANAALHYLERFAASEASLRRVLQNKIRRASMDNPEFSSDGVAQQKLAEEIEKIISVHKRSGAINDEAFAEVKVHSLRRQGRSRRAIEQKLAAKGVRGAPVRAALEKQAEEATLEEAEYKAALILARRRKWGPFRRGEVDAEKQRKEFAAMARAGFSSATAKKVLKEEPPEEWE